MKRLFSLGLLGALLLAGCGSGQTEETNGSLGSMFDSDTAVSGEDTVTAGEVPYSEGPSEIPDDLIPHE